MNRVTQAKLSDVARAAGVSLGTASNVFAHPERVRAEVRARVEAAALELGYHGPDPKGRLLRDGRCNALGLVPPAELGVADALHNPVFRNFIRGVAEVCDEAGANLVIISGRDGGQAVRNGAGRRRGPEPGRASRSARAGAAAAHPLRRGRLRPRPGRELGPLRRPRRRLRRGAPPRRARPPPLRHPLVPTRLRPAHPPSARRGAPAGRRRHANGPGEARRLCRGPRRGGHRYRQRPHGAGPGMGAGGGADALRRGARRHRLPLDVGHAGARAPEGSAPARPRRAARRLGRGLQRPSRSRHLRPAADDGGRHEPRRAAPPRGSCSRAASRATRCCRRGSSSAPRPARLSSPRACARPEGE